MGFSSSSALASNSTSTDFVAWFTDTILNPKVWEPVGWFLVRRNRARIASSVSASGSDAWDSVAATSVILRSFLPELIQGDHGGVSGLGGRRFGLGLGGLGFAGCGRRSLGLAWSRGR